MPKWRSLTQRFGGLLACALLLVVATGDPGPAARSSTGAGPLAGTLLVAAPQLGDPNFEHTVVLLADHGPEGAFGVIVNRPLGAGPMDKFMEGLGLDAEGVDGDVALHSGGPVGRGTGFVVHTAEFADETTRPITPVVSISIGAGFLEALARASGTLRYLIVFGYAGWGAGQLETEIAHGDWLVAPVDPVILFDLDDADKWSAALKKSGISL